MSESYLVIYLLPDYIKERNLRSVSRLFVSFQANQLLKFREASLVVESLSSLEKAVPSPKDEDEPDVGTAEKTDIEHC